MSTLHPGFGEWGDFSKDSFSFAKNVLERQSVLLNLHKTVNCANVVPGADFRM